MGAVLCVGLTGLADAQPVRAVPIQVAPLPAPPVGAGQPDELESLSGFGFIRVDELLEVRLNAFYAALDEGAWERAFKGYSELPAQSQGRLAPADDQGRFEPVARLIDRRMRAVPAQGRAAFRLFYDAYAADLLEKIENHPRPGSDEQLDLATDLYDWYFLSSSGARTGDLLGDLYFERGRFLEAAACWQSVLEVHPSTSRELTLQSKRAIALHRAGQDEQARALAGAISQRFQGQSVARPGQAMDAGAFLAQQLAQPTAARRHTIAPTAVPQRLPKPDAQPHWCFTIVNEANRNRMDAAMSNRRGWQYTGNLNSLLPPVVIDDRALYGHWMGAVFALDLKNGKLLWRTESFKNAAASTGDRVQHMVDQNSYRIAQSRDHILVIDAALAGQPNAYTLTAYDKQSGRVLWDTASVLQDRTFCGNPLVYEGHTYLTSRPRDAASGDLQLHQFDLTTGAVLWSRSLGELQLQISRHRGLPQSIQPVLAVKEERVYVLTNNGALIVMDRSSGQVCWAQKLDPPVHLNEENPFIVARVPDQDATPAAQPGGLVFRGDTLYAKESMSRRVYAFDLSRDELLWQRGVQSVYAELVDVEDEQLILLSTDMEIHPLDGGEPRQLAANKIGQPASNCIATDQTLYLLTNGKVLSVPIERPSAKTEFESPYLPAVEGGRLFATPDQLICVTRSGIFAFPTSTRPDASSAAADKDVLP